MAITKVTQNELSLLGPDTLAANAVSANSLIVLTINSGNNTLALQSNGVTSISVATNNIVSFPTTGALVLPTGNTSQQPASAVSGMLRFNTTSSAFEGYNGSAWAGLGGATGGGTDQIFWVNGVDITSDYTVPANTNAGTFGPVTIANNVTVTVSNTSTWTVV